jgi:dolichyl-phosphate beta-glucosyltransferase
VSSHTYSVVIPAYNESARIGATLERVLRYLTDQDWTAEVIVVNDGSKDNTAEIVRRYAATDRRLRLLENPGNRGKGYSVRTGMLRAVGDLLLFSDADLSSPIEEAAKLFEAIRAGADIAIGSRWLRSDLQKRRQSWPRQLLGRAFNLVPRLVLGLNYKDTQCGFKAFTRGAAQLVFPEQRIEGWGFDPELLFLARNNGLKVAEVPVTWAHSEGTRIRPLRDGSAMLAEMFKIRSYALTGKYAKTAVLRQGVRPQRL